MIKANKKKFWEVKNSADDTGELFIYGDIVSWKWDDTDVTAADFAKDLAALGDVKTLNIYINSAGGSVFQGQAIYSILKRHNANKNVYVDGLAASIASVIAMAGDAVYMPKNAMMMVHNPWSIAIGNAADMRKIADDLDKIRESLIAAYMAKLDGKTGEETLSTLMDEESWLTAQECLDYGFCDELIEEKQIAACADTEILAKYKNAPKNLIAAASKGSDGLDKAARQTIIAESKTKLEQINQVLGGM